MSGMENIEKLMALYKELDEIDQQAQLKSFFSYYGAKWRIIANYPKPRYNKIIEPFAGAAGYSTWYYDRNVELYDSDERIVGVWEYLIKVSPIEIKLLPSIVKHIDDFKIPLEAKWLIGYWMRQADSNPSKYPSSWMSNFIRHNSYWGDEIKFRLANQVSKIKHWKVSQKSYHELDLEIPATWFIDPPYQKAGKHYRDGSQFINYSHLGQWCQTRQGQIIACEQEGANWLPFKHLVDTRNSKNRESKEVVWYG